MRVLATLWVLLPKPSLRTVDESQQLSDRSTRFIRVPKGLIDSDSVVVLAANLFALDNSAGFEIGNDPLHGSLGYSYVLRHLSQHNGWISRQENQYMRMIRQKRPTDTSRFRLWFVERHCD